MEFKRDTSAENECMDDEDERNIGSGANESCVEIIGEAEETQPESLPSKGEDSDESTGAVPSSSDNPVVPGAKLMYRNSEVLNILLYSDFSSDSSSQGDPTSEAEPNAAVEGKESELLELARNEHGGHSSDYVQPGNQNQSFKSILSAEEDFERKPDTEDEAGIEDGSVKSALQFEGTTLDAELQDKSVVGDNSGKHQEQCAVPSTSKGNQKYVHDELIKRMKGIGYERDTAKQSKNRTKRDLIKLKLREVFGNYGSPAVVPSTSQAEPECKRKKSDSKDATHDSGELQSKLRLKDNNSRVELPSSVPFPLQEEPKRRYKRDKGSADGKHTVEYCGSLSKDQVKPKPQTTLRLQGNNSSLGLFSIPSTSKAEPRLYSIGSQSETDGNDAAEKYNKQAESDDKSTEGQRKNIVWHEEYSQAFSDAAIIVDEEDILHIFRVRKSMFEESHLLSEEFKIRSSFFIHDTSLQSVDQLVRYVFHGHENFGSLINAREDYKLAKKLQFPRFQDACVKYLMKNMNSRFAAHFREFSIEENLPGLKNICSALIFQKVPHAALLRNIW